MTWKNLIARKNIVMLGCGAVGEQMLQILRLEIPDIIPRTTIVEAMPCKKKIADAYGAKFLCYRCSENDMEHVLSHLINRDTVVVNVTVQVLTSAIIRICQKMGALYIDTSNESWPSISNGGESITADRLQNMDALASEVNGGSTALICHGANPGLVSHFVKEALRVYAASKGHSVPSGAKPWAKLARDMGLVSIHLSELDTQIARRSSLDGKFANTWSVSGFLEEANEPAHFAWGTREPPASCDAAIRTGPKKLRMVQFQERARSAVIRSWIPSQGTYDALAIPHPEVFTIAELLSCHEEDVYQPTVLFAYRPSIHCLSSLNNPAAATHHVLKSELTDGWDELGALLIFQDGNAFWYGSRLRVAQSRASTPQGNATIQQVCAGILGGIAWMLHFPRAGLMRAEDIDHDLVLEIARPYLGSLRGISCRWVDNTGSRPWPTAPLLRFGSLGENSHWSATAFA